MQYTMVAAAARQIAPSFPEVGADISWIAILFGLVGGVCTPVLGKMSDLWGKRRILLVCGFSFIVGTLICALTSTWALFLVGRALEAVAVAAPTVAYGLFRDVLPRRHVPTAIGIVAAGLGMTAFVAPLLGGWLLDHHSWRSLFWVMLVFATVMMALVWLFVPESKLRVHQRLDVLGAVLLAGGVGLVLLYVSKGASWGWGRPTAWAWLVGGLALLALFVLVERRVSEPVIEMDLLFSRKVLTVLVLAALGSIVIGTLGYGVPYMMQTPTALQLRASVLEQVASQAEGSLPASVLALVHITFSSPLSYALGASFLGYAIYSAVYSGGVGMLSGAGAGFWSRAVGPRIPMILAMATLTASTALFAFFPHSTWQYALFSAVAGLGFGAFYACAPNLIVEAVPASRQGVSAGMLGTVNSLAPAVGAAVLTAFLTANPVTTTVTVPGAPPSSTTVPGVYGDAGFRDGLLFAAACALLGLIVAIVMRHGRAAATGGEASDSPSADAPSKR
ncbi:MFS transporter [Streptomyces sp. NPDC046712]|uniref:MFS transporter n=1 Tax=Streptomyces sp. NPDC046712 TaxID=3154802 RepID=UPI0033E92D07